MSSIDFQELVPGRKMFVHVAENGHTFDLDCEPGMSIESVLLRLESLSGLAPDDQLLICGAVRLDPRRLLGDYKLPGDANDIFLFNRARLAGDCPPPEMEQIELPEVVVPPSPSPSHNPHPLDDALDPALKALPSYERQFKYHFQKGHAIYIANQARFECCKRLFQELKVQERALETARRNMDHTYRMIDQNYVDFMKRFSWQQKQHQDLLANLARDTERLRACKLHPALRTEDRKCLLDFTREDNLRKVRETCTISHGQFQEKVLQFKGMYMKLKHSIEDLFRAQSPVNVRHVEEMIRQHERYLEEQASITQSLSKDVNTVRKLVDDCVGSQLSASLRPHDAVSALGPMYHVHDRSHLPRMEACSRALSKLFEFCQAKKHEMTMCVHTSMQKVSSLQSGIRDIRFQLSAFNEAMIHQDEIFAELKLVRRIGPAYKTCLAEVVRRKALMKLYMGQAGQVAEKMARMRETEVIRREQLLKHLVAYIPRDALAAMGLFDNPSQCVVNIAPFDTNLIDIDVGDLERLAPEALVGPLPKGDHNLQGKNSFSSSKSSYHSVPSEEGSINAGKEFELQMIDEGCDSDEIIGTSKMEVENAWLKAELASAVAHICTLDPEFVYDSVDESSVEGLLQISAQKTAEALRFKDEYAKHLQNSLKSKQVQCLSYEKRIQELEQRLDQYMHLRKMSDGRDSQGAISSVPDLKADDCKSEDSVATGDGTGQISPLSPEPMDEGSCASALCTVSLKTEQLTGQTGKFLEGADENMADFPGVILPDTMPLDTSMMELRREEVKVSVEASSQNAKSAAQSDSSPANNNVPHTLKHSLSDFAGQIGGENNSASDEKDDHLELQNALSEKTHQCAEIETRMAAVLEEVASLRRELEVSLKLLDESQMNCAHLENCLHEAREESQTNLCAADRRATEYNALRSSSVKLRALLERLRNCIVAPVAGATGFTESLRALAVSLSSSTIDENEDDGTVEFRACIRVLAEKVGYLAQQRLELLERCTRAEAAQGHLSKELESKTELIKNLYAKHKMERLVNKEKISFTRFEVHELAAFVRNSAGHYEAINRNCRNYYLSEESIALFVDNLPNGRQYIIGQIVHIERNVARQAPLSSSSRSRSNPYGLPIGTEFFVVTVAMVPDTIQSPHS